MYKILQSLIILVITAALFESCSKCEISNSVFRYTPETPIMQIIEADSILLNWNISVDCANNIEFYEVFIKTYNSNVPWNSIGKITATDKCFTLKRNLFSPVDSVFEIAMRSVTKDFDTSVLVKSSEMQLTAEGDTIDGWFLFWK